ncbi:hypothetical protein GDO81_009234 [Engystomops pustulosus]|uniref:Interleukin-1 n=1 Tax=Engystomops pustulosus TaxID=76066 RepID=A0AAV7BPQ3_ENGPU|nr:hypothetical protein GDO81_009234 [Engystomops pustulosus]
METPQGLLVTFPFWSKIGDKKAWKTDVLLQESHNAGCSCKPMSSFRKAIMLVVVVEKLKGKTRSEKQDFFGDDDLLNHILVEEDITCDEIQTYDARLSKFQYNKTTVHIIRDHRQKCLALQQFQDNARLVSLFLQGQNIEREAKINVNSYITAPFDVNKRPVTLGIAGSKFYLCCSAEEGSQDPVLCLKEVDNIKDIKNDDLLPFMFFKKPSSGVFNSFESAAFPSYCISTSQQENQQVQLKPQESQVFLQDFIVNPNF